MGFSVHWSAFFDLRRLSKYTVAGGIANGVDFVLLLGLTELLEVWYVYSALTASTVAFLIKFTLKKFWVFSSVEGGTVLYLQFGLFTTMEIVNIGLNALLLYTLVEYAHIPYGLAQAGLICLFTGVAYVGSTLIFTRIFPT